MCSIFCEGSKLFQSLVVHYSFLKQRKHYSQIKANPCAQKEQDPESQSQRKIAFPIFQNRIALLVQ